MMEDTRTWLLRSHVDSRLKSKVFHPIDLWRMISEGKVHVEYHLHMMKWKQFQRSTLRYGEANDQSEELI